MEVRQVVVDDVPHLASLLRSYLAETFGAEWYGTEEALRSSLDDPLRVLAADAGSSLVGFIAWQDAYDLHSCTRGAEILDFYVLPRLKGSGLGLRLLAGAANEIHGRGGKFMKGLALKPSVSRLYARSAHCFDAVECMLGGRALRHLAQFAGKSARDIARALPDARWNYEA